MTHQEQKRKGGEGGERGYESAIVPTILPGSLPFSVFELSRIKVLEIFDSMWSDFTMSTIGSKSRKLYLLILRKYNHGK